MPQWGFVAGLLLFGGILAFGIVVYPRAPAAPKYEHDPEKMLQLRTECLRQDTTSKYTIWCDDYAEQFSRVGNPK